MFGIHMCGNPKKLKETIELTKETLRTYRFVVIYSDTHKIEFLASDSIIKKKTSDGLEFEEIQRALDQVYWTYRIKADDGLTYDLRKSIAYKNEEASTKEVIRSRLVIK